MTRFDAAELLLAAGRTDRAVGVAVAVNIGTGAAFLYDRSDGAYDTATLEIRQAIARATREEE